ncbi:MULTISPECIES: helix-turn-helix domain-containing protein [Luteimonas]|uniref:helix-turn-helix domain-containing protein n=1 Tax=Luteimonas TaxID=83614 RepID=UPI000C7D28A8|nr:MULTISPECIES: helix-turn-helix transcriptional regulator [Luteimonas]
MFAARLKATRELRGTSQRALGALLGLSKPTGSTRINRYEQLTSRPDIDTAAAIAEALDVPLAYLVADSDDLARLILAYSQLDEAQRTELLLLAEDRAHPNRT